MEINIPSQLSTKQAKEFQELYKQHFDIELTLDEAEQYGLELVAYIAALFEAIKYGIDTNEIDDPG